MAANWSKFLPEVAHEVPGCPILTIENAIRRAVIDFCERSEFLTVDLDPIDVVAGESIYDISAGTSLDIAKVLFVRFDGKTLLPKTKEYLFEWDGDWDTKVGTPTMVTQDNYNQIRLVLGPDTDLVAGLKVNVAVMPSATATGCDDVIYSRFMDAIASGAKSRLMAIPGAPWNKPDMVTFYGNQFEFEVGKAAAMAAKAYGRAPLRVTSSY
jgi:hypothetical protein